MADSSIYHQFFQTAPAAILMTNAFGQVSDANAAAAKLLGTSIEELLQKNLNELIKPSEPLFADNISAEMLSKAVMKPLQVITLAETTKRLCITASPMQEIDTNSYGVILHDQSGMLASPGERSDRLYDLQIVLDNTDELFIILDRDLKVVSMNKATSMQAKQLLGVPLEIGRSILDSAASERLPYLRSLYAEVLTGEERSSKFELTHPEKGQVKLQIRYKPILDEQEIIGVLVQVQDITEINQRARELSIANERFYFAAKATNDAIWDWDIEKDEILRVGNGLMNMFGYDPVTVAGEKHFWITRVHPEDVDRMISGRTRVLLDPQALYWEDEYRFLRSNKTYAHVYDKGYIIRDKEGRAIRMIGATQDHSERKESEALLLELNTRLKKRADELATSNIELERFAYVASHDLQEPLRMITSFLQLLRKRYASKIDETADQYIHFAMDGAERMKMLIMDLLEYSRVGSVNAGDEMVDIHQLLHDLVSFFHKTYPEKGAVIDIIAIDIPHIKANRTQLIQVFQNLVGNGLKYNRHATPKVEITYEERDGQHCFKIKDNGIGIDPSFFDKVFILFQRLHSRTEYPGTGIGLAICKKIIERHGGRIWIESQVDEGSSFYFTIPKTVN